MSLYFDDSVGFKERRHTVALVIQAQSYLTIVFDRGIKIRQWAEEQFNSGEIKWVRPSFNQAVAPDHGLFSGA